jgi:integrase
MEERYRDTNPVGRGRYTPGRAFGGHRDRGLVARFTKLPWIPTDSEWRRLLGVARQETLRTRLMLALAYDAALRREELCRLQTDDVDTAFRTLRIRAETTKTRRSRVVPYSVVTGVLLQHYPERRRGLSAARGGLFFSESRRNRTAPITLWTWSKVVAPSPCAPIFRVDELVGWHTAKISDRWAALEPLRQACARCSADSRRTSPADSGSAATGVRSTSPMRGSTR